MVSRSDFGYATEEPRSSPEIKGSKRYPIRCYQPITASQKHVLRGQRKGLGCT